MNCHKFEVSMTCLAPPASRQDYFWLIASRLNLFGTTTIILRATSSLRKFVFVVATKLGQSAKIETGKTLSWGCVDSGETVWAQSFAYVLS